MINLLSESAYVAQTNKIKTAITNKVNAIKNSFTRIGAKLGATINWLDDVESTLDDELNAINTELTDKGSTQADDFSEVAEKISDIETGVTPTGTISITANGNYDVTDYANASVAVENIYQELLQKSGQVSYLLFDTPTTTTYSTDELTVEFPNAKIFTACFSWTSAALFPFKKITISCPKANVVANFLYHGMQWTNKLEELTFVFPLKPANATNWLVNVTTIKKINGVLDGSSIEYGSYQFSFPVCRLLEEIRFAQNSLKFSMNISITPVLSQDSVLSIINGLNETVTGQTLTIHATPKATLSTMMGTVALDETETYHIFTADPNGTVSLLDFATQTKGWTVA